MDFERDLRDNLQRQAQALGSGDASLEDIRSTGRRRKAWKAAGGTFGIVAVVGFVVLGVSALVSQEDQPSVADSTVTSTCAPVTTGPPPTGTATAPPPTSVAPGFGFRAFLIEADESVVAVGTDGTEQVIYAGRYHAVAYDGAGGMVFQQEIAIEDQARDRATIYRVEAGTTEPVTLIEQDSGHIIEMFGVEDVEGVPTLLYTDRTAFDSPETAQTVLIAYDLRSGESRVLGVVGGWESGIRTVSYGDGVYAMAASAEGEVWFRYLNASGEDYLPAFDPHPVCQVGDVRCPEAPVMSPAGELVYVRHRFLDPAGDPIDLSAGEWVIVNDQGLVTYAEGVEESIITEFQEVVEIVSQDLDTGSTRILYSYESGRDQGMDGAAFVEIDFDGRYLAVHDQRGRFDAPARTVHASALIVDTDFRRVVAYGTTGRYRFPLSSFVWASIEVPGTVRPPGD